MRLPTISRARDLLAGLIGTTPLHYYRQDWNGTDIEETQIQPDPWMLRPDRRTSYAHTLSWLFDDLLFFGRAYLHIDARYSNGFPSSMSWLPYEITNLVSPAIEGNYPIGGITEITVNGQRVPTNDIIIFYSPQTALLEAGSRAIYTAELLERSAQRFASSPTAFGWLKVNSGEPMSPQELSDLAESWAEMRAGDNGTAVAAISAELDWHESDASPDRLQAIESRQHQALELARVANISPYLVGAPTGSGMTYQNAQEARRQLAQDALPFLTAIEETLSSDVVTPPGRVVRFDRTIFSESAGQGEGTSHSKELAEIVQKIYLGVVNDVITRDEARRIINEAGGDL